MIVAKIPPKDNSQKVQVLDAFTREGRKLAVVRTLDGSRPFASWTHGGWEYSDTATVPAATLQEVALECGCVLPEQACPVCRQAAREASGDGIPF